MDEWAETQSLLSSLDEAVLIIDKSQRVDPRHSLKAAHWLNKENLAGEKFYSLIAPLIPPEKAPAVNKYIDILFDASKVEKLIGSLNPLKSVRCQIETLNGKIESRQLHFEFNRLMQGNDITGVKITLHDVTQTLEQAKALEESKIEGEQQLSLFNALLSTEPDTLQSFATSCRASLNRINQILKSPLHHGVDQTETLRTKGEVMLVEMHRLKGDASALEFKAFAKQAHLFEFGIKDLIKKPDLQGDDFLPLTMQLDKLLAYTDAVEQLIQRLAIDPASEKPEDERPHDPWQHLRTLAHTIAQDEGKQVILTTTGFKEFPFSDDNRTLINDIAIQMIRNAVSHGIELPKDRNSVGKPAHGRIDIGLTQLSDATFELNIRDDGTGIDFASIREKAISNGWVLPERIGHWSNRKLFNLLFKPEFSTKGDTSEHAGQGVGLNVIRDRVKAAAGTFGHFMRLMIVDDSRIIRSKIERIQRWEGSPFEVVATASNGVEALQLLTAHDPDVVTMDLTMPELDGIACIEALIGLKPSLRILVVSAISDEETGIDALLKGAQGFL
ncbi:unnamed protein product, partial [Cyprideis torosa]